MSVTLDVSQLETSPLNFEPDPSQKSRPNMERIDCTADVSQPEISPSKTPSANIPLISFTLDVSQRDRSPLKVLLPANIPRMSMTPEVSHSERSPLNCGRRTV